MSKNSYPGKIFVLIAAFCFSVIHSAQGKDPNTSFPEKANSIKNTLTSSDNHIILSSDADTLPFFRRFTQRIGIEIRPAYIFPTHPFLRGESESLKPLRKSFSTHLKYSFQFQPDTYAGRIYKGAYQGIGLAHYQFGSHKQIGNPIAFYLFQGARIVQFSSRLSFNYEWNFGLSFGWKPYNYEKNSNNLIIGSKFNAYINTNFFLNWALSPKFDLSGGIALTHFSNGNTNYPNAGLNTIGLKLGIAYNFNKRDGILPSSSFHPFIPKFPCHISYDLVLFGSWRRKGLHWGDKKIATPDTYTVMGFSFAPMYNLGYKFRTGISIDGIYDGSANVYTEDYISETPQKFFKPSLHKQLSLGLSARMEYVMPYFTVGFGMGVNVIHGGGDLKAFYQILALKVEMTRNSFIHIGYNLKNFDTPNFLMLGVGFRLHNKYPACYRH